MKYKTLCMAGLLMTITSAAQASQQERLYQGAFLRFVEETQPVAFEAGEQDGEQALFQLITQGNPNNQGLADFFDSYGNNDPTVDDGTGYYQGFYTALYGCDYNPNECPFVFPDSSTNDPCQAEYNGCLIDYIDFVTISCVHEFVSHAPIIGFECFLPEEKNAVFAYTGLVCEQRKAECSIGRSGFYH